MPNVMAALPNREVPPSVQRRSVAVQYNSAKTRNHLKFAGVPQTNETISAASWPKFTIL